VSKKTGTFTSSEIMTSRGDTTYVRLYTPSSRPFNSEAAAAYFRELVVENGIGEIAEVTTFDNLKGRNGGGVVLLQLIPAIRTKRQAQGVVRSFTAHVDAAIKELDDEMLSSFHRKPGLDPKAIRDCSAIPAHGSMDDSYDRITY